MSTSKKMFFVVLGILTGGLAFFLLFRKNNHSAEW